MSDHIFYNFDANQGALEDIQGHIQGIHEAKEDIRNVFTLLGEVYDGEGALQLQDHHNRIQGQLEDHLNERMATHQQAADQQEAMSHLDRANAAQFG